jgi:hypothetical protein
MTELCIFARVAGRPGILPSAGICRVENKVRLRYPCIHCFDPHLFFSWTKSHKTFESLLFQVYSLLEEALQVHMRNLIMKIVDRAFQRNDSKKIVHGQYNIHSEPKQRVR